MTHFRAVLSFATSHDSKNTSKVSKTRADRQGLTKRGGTGTPQCLFPPTHGSGLQAAQGPRPETRAEVMQC